MPLVVFFKSTLNKKTTICYYIPLMEGKIWYFANKYIFISFQINKYPNMTQDCLKCCLLSQIPSGKDNQASQGPGLELKT